MCKLIIEGQAQVRVCPFYVNAKISTNNKSLSIIVSKILISNQYLLYCYILGYQIGIVKKKPPY
jgi:hypothetical protein